MKRLLFAVALVALAGAVTAALGVAAPWGGARADRGARAGAATKLPPLPAEVAQRKRWKIGVKCDSPPFGYINRQNRSPASTWTSRSGSPSSRSESGRG